MSKSNGSWVDSGWYKYVSCLMSTGKGEGDGRRRPARVCVRGNGSGRGEALGSYEHCAAVRCEEA